MNLVIAAVTNGFLVAAGLALWLDKPWYLPLAMVVLAILSAPMAEARRVGEVR